MAVQLPNGKNYFATATGAPLVGGRLYTYVPGTSTPKDTYTTSAASVANTNPVVMDARGEAAIYWSGAYDVSLHDAADALIWGPERLIEPASDADLDALIADLADTSVATKGANLVAYNPARAYTLGLGAFLNFLYARTAAEIAASVTPTAYYYPPGDVRRYGAVGDYEGGATGTENLTAFQNCILVCQESTDPATHGSNSPASGTPVMFIPSGGYRVTGKLAVTKRITIQGEGPAERSSGTRILQFNNAVDLIEVDPIAQGASFALLDVTLIGTAGGAGHLLNIKSTLASCNSIRIERDFFASPPARAIKLARCDDVVIDRSTFDASNANCIDLGTTAAADVVSACRITRNDFFEIPTRCILAYNVKGALIEGNHVTRQGATRTNYFFDAYNSLPYQIVDVVIQGNQFNSVDCIAQVTAFAGLSVNNNIGVLMGAGAGATLSAVEITGTCANFNMTGNILSGNFDAKNFYNDTGGTVTGLNISGNTLTATGGTGAAISALNSIGRIGLNTYSGFTGATTLAMQEFTANKAQWIRGENSEEITLSTGGLTTDSTANLLPANSVIESVVAYVTTTITTTTNWALGDPTTSGRFAPANATLVAGTNTVGLTHIDQTGAAGPRQTAAAKVRITCTGTNPGAGKIRVTVFYRQFVPPTS